MPLTVFTLANIGVYSFSTATTQPRAHYEFDLTNFRDPMNKSMFSGAMDGTDPKVMEWVKGDDRFNAILGECEIIAHDQKVNQGGRWLTIGFRDFHGVWKSRAMAELIAHHLADLGHNVCVFHNPITDVGKDRVGG